MRTVHKLHLAAYFIVSSQLCFATPPIQDLHLGVGLYPSEKNISFYTPQAYEHDLYVQIAPSSALIDGEFPNSAARFITTHRTTDTEYRSHQTIVNNLQESTPYSYRVGSDEQGWSTTYEFSTFATDSFSFIVAGDPQVGVDPDSPIPDPSLSQQQADNWQRVMATAHAAFPESSFFIAPGDVVNRAAEYLFHSLLSSDIVNKLPSIMLEASHDDDLQPKNNSIFHQHIFQPTATEPEEPIKGFFWWRYGDALFITTDHHNAEQIDLGPYIAQVVEKFPDVKWRIYVAHYSFYASGNHANHPYELYLREQLTPLFTNLGIDLVIFGHDHTYVRTPQLVNDAPVATEPHASTPLGVLNPQGTVFVTANSSSGSKYYHLVADAHDRHYSGLVRQNYTPSFLNIEISENDLTLRAFEVNTDNSLFEFDQYRIHKTAVRPIANTDYDGDGYPNDEDQRPFDPLEIFDWDGDGRGDNADNDDDNDGIPDNRDAFPFTPYRYASAKLQAAYCPIPKQMPLE